MRIKVIKQEGVDPPSSHLHEIIRKLILEGKNYNEYSSNQNRIKLCLINGLYYVGIKRRTKVYWDVHLYKRIK